MHLTFPNLALPSPPKPIEVLACKQQIEEVAAKIFEMLLLVLYTIEYVIISLMQDSSMRHRIFQGRVLTKTHNHARFSELHSYIKMRKAPISLHENALQTMRVAGCSPTEKPVTLKPFDKGKCFGATTLFAKEALEGRSLEEVVTNFSRGVPIEGAFLQHIYQKEQPILNYPSLTEEIIQYIESEEGTRPSSLKEKGVALYDAIDDFLAEERGSLEGFTQFVIEKVLEKTGTRFIGALKGTLYHVEEYFTKNVPAGKIREENLHSFSGLKSEYLHYETSSEEVLDSFSTLDKGVYQISFPTYSPLGNEEELHAVSFVIRETGLCYLYDPNCALGWSTRGDLQATMGRLFEEYTGWNFQGATPVKPHFGRRLLNFFQERANPPPKLPPSFTLAHLIKLEIPKMD